MRITTSSLKIFGLLGIYQWGQVRPKPAVQNWSQRGIQQSTWKEVCLFCSRASATFYPTTSNKGKYSSI